MCDKGDRQVVETDGGHFGREPPGTDPDAPEDSDQPETEPDSEKPGPEKSEPQTDLPPDGTQNSQDPQDAQNAQKDAKYKRKVRKKAVRLLIKLGVIALTAYVTLTFIFGIYRVSGNDMYPALRDGDLCITYRIGDCYAGDTVAYRTPDGIRLGRVVAREGDTVDGDEQGIVLNGAPPAEEIFYPTPMLDTALKLPVKLKEGEYVILNDYRSNLRDSRTYGVIPKDALCGKVIFLFRRRGF